jgi:hypothetical protein
MSLLDMVTLLQTAGLLRALPAHAATLDYCADA